MGNLGSGHGYLRRGLAGALLAGSGLLAAACSSPAPQTFHPASDASTATTAPAATRSASPLTLVRPPFGHNAHVLMTPWLPARHAERLAVMSAKDFVLAVLYADYTGDRDQRYRSYVATAKVRTGLAQTLNVPSVTTESFTGTVRFWRMHAARGPKGTVVVTECVDTSRARNTRLSSGRILPPGQQTPHNDNYYLNSDVLARESSGRWGVTSIPATIYYPRAQECKP